MANGDASGAVKGPAISLMVVGGINVLGGLYYIFSGIVSMLSPAPAPPPNVPQEQMAFYENIMAVSGGIGIVLGLVILAVAGIIIYGSMKMMNLQSFGLAMTGSILAMVPCISCCLLGLPLGIWSLVVLNKPEVKSAFQ